MDVRKRVVAAGLAVCRDLCSLESRTVKKWALAALMALAVLAIGGRSAKASPQSIDCTDGQTPSMTLEIYNNSVRLQHLSGAIRRRAERYGHVDASVFPAHGRPARRQSVPKGHPISHVHQLLRQWGERHSAGRFGDDHSAALLAVGWVNRSEEIGPTDRLVAGRRHQLLSGPGHEYEARMAEPPAVLQQHWKADQKATGHS